MDSQNLKCLCAGAIGVSLLAACSQPPEEGPDELSGIDTSKFTAFSEIAVRQLPANAITSTFGPDGGEMSLGDIHLIVPEGVVEEHIELSLIPAIFHPQDWSSRADRIRPVGQPFSVAARGAVADLKDIDIRVDGVELAEGEQFQLARLPSQDAMIEQGDEPTLESRESAQQPSRASGPGATAQSSLPVMTISCTDNNLRFALGDLDTDWINDTYQVVVTRGAYRSNISVDNDGVVDFCIYVLDRSVHGANQLIVRLERAALKVAEKAQELGLEPLAAAGPKSITVQSFTDVPSETRHALAVGSRHIAMSRNIHVYPPYEAPGFLESTLADMYMRLVWNNAAPRETLTLKEPNVNQWIIEGSSEWFVDQVFGDVPNYGRNRIGHFLDSLFSVGSQSSEFIEHLETANPGILRRLIMWTHQAKMIRPKSNLVQYPKVLLSELLNRMLELETNGDGLSTAYSEFARSAMTFEGDPSFFPKEPPYSSISVSSSDADVSPVTFSKSLGPLAGRQILFHSPIQRGSLLIQATEVATRARGDMPDLNIQAQGLEADGNLVPLALEVLAAPSSVEGKSIALEVDDFGEGGRYVGVLLQIVHDDFSRYSAAGTGGSSAARAFEMTRDIGDALIRFEAGFTELTLPMSTLRSTLSGDDKHCVGNIPGRQCQATIQQAINLQAVEPGDSILVAAGHYNESVEVTKANLTIRGAASGQVFVESNGSFAFDIQASGTQLMNLVIVREGRKFPGNADWVINVEDGVSSSRIENNIIIANPGSGIKIPGGNDHRIVRNWITVTNNGIEVNSALKTHIGNNIIAPVMVRNDVRSWEIDSNGVVVPGDRIEFGNHGIQITGSDHTNVTGNYVIPDLERPSSAWHQALVADTIDGLQLMGNYIFTSSTQAAITISNTDNLIANNNHVTNANGRGFHLGVISTGNLARNVVDARTTALNIVNSRTITMSGNLFYGNGGALHVNNSQGIFSTTDYFDGWPLDRYAADSFNKRAVYLQNVVSATLDEMYVVGTTESVRVEGSNGIHINNSDIHQLREEEDGPFNPGVAYYLKNTVNTQVVGGMIISNDGGVRVSGDNSTGNSFDRIHMADPDLEVGFYLESEADISNIFFYPGSVDYARSRVPVILKNTIVGLSVPGALVAIDELKMFGVSTSGFNFIEQHWMGPRACENAEGGAATPFYPFLWRAPSIPSEQFSMRFSQTAALSPLAPTPGYRAVMCLPSFVTGEWRAPNTAIGGVIAVGLQRVE